MGKGTQHACFVVSRNKLLTRLGKKKEGQYSIYTWLPEDTAWVEVVFQVNHPEKKDVHQGSHIVQPKMQEKQSIRQSHFNTLRYWVHMIPEHGAFQFPWAYIWPKNRESQVKGMHQGHTSLHYNKTVISLEGWILYCLLAESRIVECHPESSFHSHQFLSWIADCMKKLNVKSYQLSNSTLTSIVNENIKIKPVN